MFAQLGSIVFDARYSPTAFTLAEEENVVEMPLVDTKPTLQRVGSKLDKINLSMLLDASFCNPIGEIDKLRAGKDISEIMPLIMGNGLLIGDFVIMKMTVNILNAAPDGLILQADVQVELIEYYDPDREATQQIAAIEKGFAMEQNVPAEYVPVMVPQTDEAIAMAGVVQSNAASVAASSLLDNIADVASQYRPKAETILQNTLITHDSLGSVLALINEDPLSDIYGVTRDLASNIGVMLLLVDDITVEVQMLITNIDTGNTTDIPAAIVTLTARGGELKSRAKNIMSSASALTALTVKQ